MDIWSFVVSKINKKSLLIVSQQSKILAPLILERFLYRVVLSGHGSEFVHDVCI